MCHSVSQGFSVTHSATGEVVIMAVRAVRVAQKTLTVVRVVKPAALKKTRFIAAFAWL